MVQSDLGEVHRAVIVRLFRAPVPSLMAGDKGFLRTFENVFTCGGDPPFLLTWSYIARVDFGTTDQGLPLVRVAAASGEKKMSPTDIQACFHTRDSKGLYRIPTKTYYLEFIFDGRDYKPSPSSASAARIFAYPTP